MGLRVFTNNKTDKNGEVVESEENIIPWTPLSKPISRARFALVSTAGVHLISQESFNKYCGGESMKRKTTCKAVTGNSYNEGVNFRVLDSVIIIRVLGSVAVLGAFIIILAGCGMGMVGFHDDDEGSDGFMNEGFFMDSAVKGLHYESATQSGTTGSDGGFNYENGELVTFKMGPIVLGTSMGDEIITPIDMVPGAVDEKHPTVTNMLRFMQTLDEDNNPENGITLPGYMMDELERHTINFNMTIEEFEHDPNIEQFMADMHLLHENYENMMMVSVKDAQAHMRNTMMSMMGSAFDPHNMQGAFIDSPVQGLYYETETHFGITNEDGHFYYKIGEDVSLMMGDIELGRTHGKAIVTPVDIVPGAIDETHPTVSNMLRFLQSMDVDNMPDNGIDLPDYMLEELEGRSIQFQMTHEEFENDPDVLMFMDTMSRTYEAYNGRKMVSAEDAQEHMRNTMGTIEHNPTDDTINDTHNGDDMGNENGMMM